MLNSYDLKTFYTASTDPKGHLTTLRVNLPPTMLHTMGNYVASRKIPQYRSNADIARDAIYHRLHWLTEEYDANEFAPELNLWRIRQDIVMAQEAETSANDILRYVWDHLSDSGTAEIIKNVLSSADLPVHMKAQFEGLLAKAEMRP